MSALIRERLEKRLVDLAVREEALEKHLRGQDGRLEANFSDRVAFTEMDEVLEQLEGAGRDEMSAILASVKALDDGTYGVCTSCGKSLQPRRLEILPHARTCVWCAAK